MRQADARLTEIDRRIFYENARKASCPKPVRPMREEARNDDKGKLRVESRTARLLPAAFKIPHRTSEPGPLEWDSSDAEINQLMVYVLAAPHVVSNARYVDVAARVVFNVLHGSHEVNAFATAVDGDEFIVLHGGMVRMCNLIAAAYVGGEAVRSSGAGQSPFAEIIADLGRYCVKCNAALTPRQADRFARDHNLHLVMGDEVLSRKARSFAAGMLTVTLAHEFGHLALGHCDGAEPVNLEVSRNQEREADSFANSVISSSPFGDYLVIGSMLAESVWLWVQDATGEEESTHPLARERLAALVRANPSVAADLGLDKGGLVLGFARVKCAQQVPRALQVGRCRRMTLSPAGMGRGLSFRLRNAKMVPVEMRPSEAAEFSVSDAGRRLSGFLRATEQEVEQLFEFVRESAETAEVPGCGDKMGLIRFRYDDGVLGDGIGLTLAPGGCSRRVIAVPGGLVAYAQLVGALAAKDLRGGSQQTGKALSRFMPLDFAVFSADEALSHARGLGCLDLIGDADLRRKALEISGSMVAFAIAHEVAHVLLGHAGDACDFDGTVIEQDQAADVLAERILSGGVFGSSLPVGRLLWLYALAGEAGEDGDETPEPPKHPFAEERYRALAEKCDRVRKALGLPPDLVGRFG